MQQIQAARNLTSVPGLNLNSMVTVFARWMKCNQNSGGGGAFFKLEKIPEQILWLFRRTMQFTFQQHGIMTISLLIHKKTIVIKYKFQSALIYVCRMKRGCIYAVLTAKYALNKTSYSGRINNTEALLPMRKTKTFASRMSYAGEVRNCSAAHSW